MKYLALEDIKGISALIIPESEKYIDQSCFHCIQYSPQHQLLIVPVESEEPFFYTFNAKSKVKLKPTQAIKQGFANTPEVILITKDFLAIKIDFDNYHLYSFPSLKYIRKLVYSSGGWAGACYEDNFYYVNEEKDKLSIDTYNPYTNDVNYKFNISLKGINKIKEGTPLTNIFIESFGVNEDYYGLFFITFDENDEKGQYQAVFKKGNEDPIFVLEADFEDMFPFPIINDNKFYHQERLIILDEMGDYTVWSLEEPILCVTNEYVLTSGHKNNKIYSIKMKQKIIEFSLPKEENYLQNFQGTDKYLYWIDEELDVFYVLKSKELIKRILNKG